MKYIDEIGVFPGSHARTIVLEKACAEVDSLRLQLARALEDAERAKGDLATLKKANEQRRRRLSGKFSILPDGSFGPHSDDTK